MMVRQKEATKSIWQNFPVNNSSKLEKNIETEVCIIGAGMAGMSSAYMLSKSGKKVVVLEMYEIANAQSGRTTAQITYQVDIGYNYIQQRMGTETSKLVYESQKAAMQKIEETINEENIKCDFEKIDTYLYCPLDSNYDLEAELKSQKDAGINDTQIIKEIPLPYKISKALKIPNQAQFNPLKYIGALKESIIKNKGEIYTSTRVKSTDTKDNKIVITTENGNTVTADHLIVATDTPINNIVTIHTKQAAYRTYVIGAKVPKGSVEKAVFWDTLDPYHYIRLYSENDYDVLIIGGEDHKTGQSDDEETCFFNLESWSKAHFNMIEEILYRWSGQVQEPIDGLAYLGKNPGDSNVYIITGDSGTGMTNTTLGAMIITDLINGKENKWANVYSPSRIPVTSGDTFIKEGLNVAAQLTDLVTPGEIKNEEEIKKGEGGILREGLTKTAVYRDESGTIHKCSAICPHLGCVVDWNNLEKSWDCPCHGSRFDAYGKLLTGPAISDLSKK